MREVSGGWRFPLRSPLFAKDYPGARFTVDPAFSLRHHLDTMGANCRCLPIPYFPQIPLDGELEIIPPPVVDCAAGTITYKVRITHKKRRFDPNF